MPDYFDFSVKWCIKLVWNKKSALNPFASSVRVLSLITLFTVPENKFSFRQSQSQTQSEIVEKTEMKNHRRDLACVLQSKGKGRQADPHLLTNSSCCRFYCCGLEREIRLWRGFSDEVNWFMVHGVHKRRQNELMPKRSRFSGAGQENWKELRGRCQIGPQEVRVSCLQHKGPKGKGEASFCFICPHISGPYRKIAGKINHNKTNTRNTALLTHNSQLPKTTNSKFIMPYARLTRQNNSR